MTIRIMHDTRDRLGHGEVFIEAPDLGQLRLYLGDIATLFPWWGHTETRVPYYGPGQWAPVVQIRAIDQTGNAPRSKHQINGGVRTAIDATPSGNPRALLHRSDWRLKDTRGYNGYKDKMMSAAQWETFREWMLPVCEWIFDNAPKRPPIVDPSVQNNYDNALRQAATARDRWQAAEQQFLIARDKLAAEEDRVAAALATV